TLLNKFKQNQTLSFTFVHSGFILMYLEIAFSPLLKQVHGRNCAVRSEAVFTTARAVSGEPQDVGSPI
ncbi:MAG: hypothetical protein LRY51_05005, partial [Geovibrio sp.]|nr:hypothetical protein [Geovibrio sp.]